MCLSNVMDLTSGKPTQIASSVQDVSIKGDVLTFTDILGQETVFKGRIAHIDLIKNVIAVNQLSTTPEN